MFSKIMFLLITLSLSSILAHDNFNQISANVDPSALNSTHLKFNHQSYFYIPNGDAIILDLIHGIHSAHFQNDIGLAYRKLLRNVGIGANFYYQHTTRPKTLIHQFSPGLELLCKNLQVSYNLYIPLLVKKDLKGGSIFHSKVSEIGVKWYPIKELSIGLLSFYDHKKQEWGLNSKTSYIFNDKFEFGIVHHFDGKSKGFTFSFAFNFGPGKGVKPIHRSNSFIYFIENTEIEKQKISVEKSIIAPSGDDLPPQKPEDAKKTDGDEKDWSSWWYRTPIITSIGAGFYKIMKGESTSSIEPVTELPGAPGRD